MLESLLIEDENGDLWHELSTGSERERVTPARARELRQEAIAAEGGRFVSGYHIATRDHPFLNMAEGMAARAQDAEIMAGFLRSDRYPSVFLDIEGEPRVRLYDAAHLGTDELANSSLCQLSMLISGTFGTRRLQAAYHDPTTGYHQGELVGRSVPSGGSRHPSECFVEIHRSPEIPSGWYHFSSRTTELVPCPDLAAEPAIKAAAARSLSPWVIAVYIHSVVDRAMFRYRDPRSARAILVDAGHADAQLAALAAYCNWRYRSASTVRMGAASDELGMKSHSIPRLLSGLLEGGFA